MSIVFFTHATASRIKTFKQCEFRYFLEYVVQLPAMRKDNIYSGKGSAIHVALEKWANAKLGKENAEEDWEKTLREYYVDKQLWTLDNRQPDKHGNPKGFPHPVEKTCESCPWATKDDRCLISNRAIAATDGCPRPNFQEDVDLIKKTLTRTDYNPLKLIQNEEGEEVFERKIIGVEYKFETTIGGVKVRGVIDLLAEEDEDTIEIIDYKSGKSMSYNKAFDDPQVRIYDAVVRKLFPQYKNVLVTLYYLKKYPVTVSFGPDDVELTVKSLQRAQRHINEIKDPRRITPSRWGFPCDWCIGHDTCGRIKDQFRVNGRFKLPTLVCQHFDSENCHGNLHPIKQEVTLETVTEIIYACKGHMEISDGGEYVPKQLDGSFKIA